MRKIIRKKETQNLPTIKDTLLSQPMVGQHLKFLKEHGADRTIVLGLLAIISRLVRVPDSADWADESGKTTVTLNRFPARIEGLASDIERIDAYGLLDPAVGVSALWTADPIEMRRKFADELPKLPVLLRLRADLLRWQIQFIQHQFEEARKHHQSILTTSKLLLSEYVHFSTGELYTTQIADLLTASYAATASRKIVTEYSLLKLRQRYAALRASIRKRLEHDLGGLQTAGTSER